MKRIFPGILFLLNLISATSQETLIIEGTVVNNKETGNWLGVNIPRTKPTKFTFRYNSVTSVNSAGYLLQAGDETPDVKNNNLDGQVINGNRFEWNGPENPAIITHGVFLGYNKNSIVKYNYLEDLPYGIIFKSGTADGVNMTFTSGGCAYNIVKNGKYALRMKGINGVKIYNNTFFHGDNSGWYLALITQNSDQPVPSPSTGARIFNNIFYATKKIPMIKIESGCLTDFECDYNLYWCTVGEPVFMIDGEEQSWAEWRARGFDAHSIIADPDFMDEINFVPKKRLDFGINLGEEWKTGLSAIARWIPGVAPATTNQGDVWQVGAVIHPLIPDNGQSDKQLPVILNNDIIEVLLKDKYLSWTAGLYDIRGSLLASRVVEGDLLIFDASSLSPGVYFVKINKGNDFSIGKVVKP